MSSTSESGNDDDVNGLVARLRREGRRPPDWCSFACPLADTSRSQHAACLAVNGVWCRPLEAPVEKGAPCRFRRRYDESR